VQPFSDLSPTRLMSIFYCFYFWDSPNLEGQVPVFISPRNRVAQLYPPALGLDSLVGLIRQTQPLHAPNRKHCFFVDVVWWCITCSIVEALFVWYQTMWQYHVSQLTYCCMIPLLSWSLFLPNRSLASAISLAPLFCFSGVSVHNILNSLYA
jgi:hypothetical protein